MSHTKKEDTPAATVEQIEATSHTGQSPEDLKGLSSTATAHGQGLTGYEHLGVWASIKKFKVASAICFLTAISAAAEGYQISLVGSIIANPGFVKVFATQVDETSQPTLASSVLSTWGSLSSVGQLVGQLLISFVSNRFGRKISMYSLWLILALSIIVEGISRNWRVWLAAKILGGLGVGCLQATLPLYIGEIAPIRIRGTFLMCYTMWWVTGQFFAPIALQSFSKSDPENWLTPVFTQWAHIGLMFVIFLVVPESPSWYILRGKAELAKKSLRFIYWRVDGFDINHQYNLLSINVDHERDVAKKQEGESWYEIFRGINRLRTIISFWAIMTQQFLGLQVFFTYGTYFFQQAGLEDPFMATCITSGVNIAASLVIICLADITGRRWMVTWGSTLCWVCGVGVGTLGVVPKNGASDIILVIFAVFWNIGLIANSAGGYACLSEVSSLRLRTFTIGFAIGIIGPVGIVMGILVPYMLNANQWDWGLKTTWFFTGIGAPFLLALWFLIPETSGRSTAELDELFERKIKPWRFHKTLTLTQRMAEKEGTASKDG
ncbi:general substrate transporter [Aspergillus pseudoustus]|uniref:General substrate transporter n=1 Tax=Aspergillus pseudoustus TaxID=1810923 RepID=A0ABR4JTG2_9EURO